MEKLVQQFRTRLNSVNLHFKRYLWPHINWENRLLAIVGARGVGKTTLILQHIRQNHKNLDEVLYVSMDNLYFGKVTLSDFTEEFVKQGGKFLFLDEIHKYPDWSIEIKNIYDTYPELKIVITGSSALNIHKGKGDLSRRIKIHNMNGLSFREFLLYKHKLNFPVYGLSEILENANEIAQNINERIKPLKYFTEYLQKGYYPYFAEDEEGYYQRIEQTVNQIIESDLPTIENIDYNAIHNLRKLLSVIAEVVPFKPNVSKLSQKIGVNRETFLKYLYWMHHAELLLLLTTDKFGISKMNKPDKVFLNNTNLVFALTESKADTGTLRETFFYNQLKVAYDVRYTDIGDFIIDNKYTFEIGGKNKTRKQIAGIENAYIAADNIEYPYKNTIPVWMFGFLY